MSCSKILCEKKVYNRKDHRNALLQIKKNVGYKFEEDEDYKKVANCLSEVVDYKDENQCNTIPAPRPAPSFAPFTPAPAAPAPKKPAPGKFRNYDYNIFRENDKKNKEKYEMIKKIKPSLLKQKAIIEKRMEKYHGATRYPFDKQYREKLSELEKLIKKYKKANNDEMVKKTEDEYNDVELNWMAKKQEVYSNEKREVRIELETLEKEMDKVIQEYLQKQQKEQEQQKEQKQQTSSTSSKTKKNKRCPNGTRKNKEGLCVKK